MFQWIQRTKGHFQEIFSLVGLVTGYGMAITGKSPTPWPQTTATSIMFISMIFLWGHWLPRISRRSSLFIPGTTDIQLPWLAALLDPFRASSRYFYSLSLPRRRLEGLLLVIITIGGLALSSYRFRAVLVEIFPSTLPIPMTCLGDGSPEALRIVIAEFNKVGDAPLLEDRLFDLLTDHSRWMGKVHVCRTDEIIKNKSEAFELGEKTLAAIVVWGRSDPALYEVNFEVAEWPLPDKKFRSFPTPEALTPEFQLREPLRTSFLTEFILSDLLFLRGDTIAARDLLEKALLSARDAGLDQESENKDDLAVAYFLLGYYYDESISAGPNLGLAIKYYTEAIGFDNALYRAYINRGKTYEITGQIDLALADYQTCASLAEKSNPDLAAAALINTAWLYVNADPNQANDYFAQAIVLDPYEGYIQRGLARSNNWQQMALAIEDFSKALVLDGTDPHLYDFLGRAQLLNGQPNEAIQTYQKAISSADWQPGDKDTITNNLLAMGKDPTPNQAVSKIINALESASLP